MDKSLTVSDKRGAGTTPTQIRSPDNDIHRDPYYTEEPSAIQSRAMEQSKIDSRRSKTSDGILQDLTLEVKEYDIGFREKSNFTKRNSDVLTKSILNAPKRKETDNELKCKKCMALESLYCGTCNSGVCATCGLTDHFGHNLTVLPPGSIPHFVKIDKVLNKSYDLEELSQLRLNEVGQWKQSFESYLPSYASQLYKTADYLEQRAKQIKESLDPQKIKANPLLAAEHLPPAEKKIYEILCLYEKSWKEAHVRLGGVQESLLGLKERLLKTSEGVDENWADRFLTDANSTLVRLDRTAQPYIAERDSLMKDTECALAKFRDRRSLIDSINKYLLQ